MHRTLLVKLLSFTLAASLLACACASPNFPDEDLALPERTEAGAALPPASSASSPPPAPASDAGAGDAAPSAPAPTTAACDLTKPFAAPTLLAGLGSDEATPRLSHDELVVYFTTHESGLARIARATRATRTAPFGPKTIIDVGSGAAKDNDPSISADGKQLFFTSERSSDNDRIFVADLIAGTTMFGPPKLLPVAAASGADDQHPYFRAMGGGELWFSSTRGGSWDLYVAKTNGTGFDAPKRIDELHASQSSRQPMITEDGLTLLFASERSGGLGQRDLWIAKRPFTTSPFGSPEAVTSVNSSADEFAGWLSPDGCRLYFSSDRSSAKTHRLYVASRP